MGFYTFLSHGLHIGKLRYATHLFIKVLAVGNFDTYFYLTAFFFFEGGTSGTFIFFFNTYHSIWNSQNMLSNISFKLSIFMLNHWSGKASNQNPLASFHEICIGKWFFQTLFFHDLSLSQSDRTPLENIIAKKCVTAVADFYKIWICFF